MSLSDRQEAAVRAAPGGLFVSAAAGSGKTRVLTARFVKLVGEEVAAGSNEPLDSLIAITFTEKAAGELSQRIRGTLAREVDISVAREAERAWISTIHGLCRRLLKRHAFEAGLDPGFGVCDDVQSGMLRRQAFLAAVRASSRSMSVERLLTDYDAAEVESGIRAADELIRSFGLGPEALGLSEADIGPALTGACLELRSLLGEMAALSGGAATEEKNIEALADLLEELDAVDANDPEAGSAVLAAATGFKQSKACRGCAKPLAVAVEECVGRLVAQAAGHAAAVYVDGFLGLLECYSHEYAQAKAERGVLDFEDLQLRARDLLREHSDLVRRYRDALVEVMVDEFQDTNELQLSVVSLLAGDALATVGDEKQSIYGWRNADIEVFRRRRRELDESRFFSLPENYRSDPELVEFFNELFSADPFWPGDFMRLEVGPREPDEARTDTCPLPGSASRVQLTLLDSNECDDGGNTLAEAQAVADWFSYLRAEGVRQKDLVLLLRAMPRAEVFEAALRERGFDVFVASGGAFFDTREIDELRQLLRVVANTRDDEAFARLLAGRMANLSDDALYLLRSAASPEHGERTSLWQAAVAGDRPALSPEDEAALCRVLDVVTEIRGQQGRMSLYDLIHSACKRLGYDLTLYAAGERRAWPNVLKFARLAGEFEQLAAGDPGAFLEYLDERRLHQRYEQQAAIAAEEVDAVRIMSVHSAKGLEFPVVALAELGKGGYQGTPTFECGSPDGELTLGILLPLEEPFTTCRKTRESDAVREWRAARELDEAKRIFYVACTRATEALGLFAVTDASKEPPAAAPVAWLTRAIGLSGEVVGQRDSAEMRSAPLDDEATAEGAATAPECRELDVCMGAASVRVRLARPSAREEAGPDERAPHSGAVPRGKGSPGPAEPGCAAEPETRREPSSARPERISFTRLKTYLDCSYRYYASYVAGIGTLDGAHGQNDPLDVGSAVHQALRLADPTVGLPEAALRSIAQKHGVGGEEGAARVKESVECFLASILAHEAFSATRVLREVPFGADVAGTTLEGALDLLAVSGGSATVVDYKTGANEPDADALERWRLQSVCYAVAVFDGLPDVAHVEVVFFACERNGDEERFIYERDDLPALTAEIEAIVSRIADEDFVPLESYNSRACRGCPASGNLCSFSE